MALIPNTQAPNLLQDIRLSAQTANGSFIFPAGGVLRDIIVTNTTSNAATGGVSFGTTNAGTDVVAALAIGANGVVFVTDALMLKRYFSSTVSQQIFFNAIVSWNSASVQIDVLYYQL